MRIDEIAIFEAECRRNRCLFGCRLPLSGQRCAVPANQARQASGPRHGGTGHTKGAFAHACVPV